MVHPESHTSAARAISSKPLLSGWGLRWRWVVVVGGVLVLASAYPMWKFTEVLRDPQRVGYRQSTKRQFEWNAVPPGRLGTFEADLRWVLDTVPTLPEWDARDAQRLADLVRLPFSDSEPSAADPDSVGRLIAQGSAVDAIDARLLWRMPVTPEARAIMVKAVSDELDHDHWSRRSTAACVLIGLGEDRAPGIVHDRIQQLRKDPDPQVALTVELNLTYAQEDEAARAARAAKAAKTGKGPRP